MSNFIQKCLEGNALLGDIDDFVDSWHENDSTLSLHRFLGMTHSEYSLWIADPDVLAHIVNAHRQDREGFVSCKLKRSFIMSSVGEDLPKEQARVREVLGYYKEIGKPGVFGAMMIEATLKKADEAVISGDIVQMMSVCRELKDIKG